jgi:hypothetical protein
MPRSPNSSQSTSRRYSPTFHYTDRTLPLYLCEQVLDRREDFATAINLLGNERETFSEIILLDYCLRTIKGMEATLANHRNFTEEVIARLVAKKSSDRFYEWVRNRGMRDNIPVGSDHTPPDSSDTPATDQSSQNEPLPIPSRPRPQETTILPRFPLEEELSDYTPPPTIKKPQFISPTASEFLGPPGTPNNPIIVEGSDDSSDDFYY